MFTNMMKKNVLIILAFLLSALCGRAQSYGLQFSSFEVPQEKRTGLILNPDNELCYNNNARLSFDLNFLDQHIKFGIVCRLINNHSQNIDLIYNQNALTFYVVFKETITPLHFQISDSTLLHSYTNIGFEFKDNTLSVFLNNKLSGQTPLNLKDHCFKYIFGICNLPEFKTLDVPPMQIRNIRLDIDNRKQQYYWPLNQSKGQSFSDSNNTIKSTVTNPTWIQPLHAKWQLVKSFTVNGNASSAFDPKNETLYIVAKDSLFQYTVAGGVFNGTALSLSPYRLQLGNQSIYNKHTSTLYNFFVDKNWIASYDKATRQWSSIFDSTGSGSTEYWHANKFICYPQNALYVIGGYGQLYYKNNIQKYDFSTHQWSKVKPSGDTLLPHYLGSLATVQDGKIVYLIGGYGSISGDQMLNPHHMYDLFRYDVVAQSMKKVYTLPKPASSFVFANSFIANENDGSFYALTFPNDRHDSYLQLIKGSLTQPHYAFAADSIPYTFQDNRSYADLFLCQENNSLLAITLFTEKEKSTKINIYTISFPPNLLSYPNVQEGPAKIPTGFYWTIGILAVASILLLTNHKKRSYRQPSEQKETMIKTTASTTDVLISEETIAEEKTFPENETINENKNEPYIVPNAKAAIMLFGQFEVVDKNGTTLTHLFTPLLKELFLLFVLYTIKREQGISSEKLNTILWSDKSSKDAKNNRSVNMVKLKNILEQLGECKIVKHADLWKLEYNPETIHIDLYSFLSIASQNKSFTKQQVLLLVAIVHKGALLNQTDYDWLDDIKSDFSNKVIDTLLTTTTILQQNKDHELLIEITNCIFQFDSLNEDALKLKCGSLVSLGRHSLARNSYERFIKEYQQIYGEPYPEPYSSFLSGV